MRLFLISHLRLTMASANDCKHAAKSIPAEQIARIDLLLHVIQTAVISVGKNSLTTLLKRLKVIDNLAAKERRAIFQRRLVDDDRRSLCLDTLHNPLNRGLAEVIRIGLHRQAVNTDDTWLFSLSIILIILVIAVIPCHLKNAIGNEILARAIGLHNSFNQIFRNILIIGEKLLGILGRQYPP